MANKSVTLDILGRNTDAVAKIDQVKKDYEELKAKVDEGKLDISAKDLASAYRSQLRSATKELFQAGQTAEETKAKFNGLGLAMNALGVDGLQNVGEMSLFQKAMLGLNVATGIGEPIVASLTVGIAALASGVASAGLGLGVFGAAAESAFSQVETANTAGTKLTGGLGELQGELKKATAEWDNFGKANANGVADVLGHGLQLIPEALKAVQPFLAPTEKALDSIFDSASKAMSSGGFKSFMDSFAAVSGTNLKNIAGSIGHIIVGLGGVLKAFLPLGTTMTSGLDKITAKFATWGTTLTKHSGFQDLISEADEFYPKVKSVFENLGSAVKDFVSDSAGITVLSNSGALWNILNPLSAILKLLAGNKELMTFALYSYAAFSGVSKLNGGMKNLKQNWESLSGTAVKLGKAMGLLTVTTDAEGESQLALNAAFFASPVTWIVVGLAAVTVGIVELSKHSEAFRSFWKSAWKDIKLAASDVFDWVKHNWPLMLGILLGPIALAAVEIGTHWRQITSGARETFDAVTGFFRSLPGRILAAVGKLGSLLFSAGSDVIHGLLNGIDSAAGGLLGTVESLGSKISGVFKTVMGIFSPSRVFADHGRNIVLGLVQGIDGNSHLASDAVSRMATRAVNAGAVRPGALGRNGGQNVTVTLEFDGAGADQALVTALKRMIRVRGGDANVLGR